MVSKTLTSISNESYRSEFHSMTAVAPILMTVTQTSKQRHHVQDLPTPIQN